MDDLFARFCELGSPLPPLVSTQLIKQISNISDVLEGKSQEKLTENSLRVILSALRGFLETLALYDKANRAITIIKIRIACKIMLKTLVS